MAWRPRQLAELADHSSSTPQPSGQQPPHHARADLGGEPVLDARARWAVLAGGEV
ncbi:hypothetical protein ACFV2X_54370 [Streptomyces sp. NPDC059679]|uniref:hypothetical protein n=1 Tax=Streptomyces sp. NPDC059679 TaxID=3346903 RepID=UPI0036CA458F